MTASSEPDLLSAVHLATRKLASSRGLDDVLPEVLRICVEAADSEGGTIYLHDKGRRTLEFRHVLPEASASALQFSDIPDDHGVAGRVFQTRRTEITQFEVAPEETRSIAEKAGFVVRTMITACLMLEDMEPIGVVQLINKRGGAFSEDDQTVVETVCNVSTLSYVNWQLLEEQSRSSQLLGMGRVAHDIKNMAFALEANLTFSNHTLNEARDHAQATYSTDPRLIGYVEDIRLMVDELHGSIDRIKRYSMLMSDLSAGKTLQPEMVRAPLAHTIRLSAAYLESEARKQGLTLKYEIDENAPDVPHDEMYVFRIVQNLVSNAIKAVAETADTERHVEESVTIRYTFADGWHRIEVQDTGPGMTEETARRILSGNVRSVWSKSTGSGWGTKIVLELAATHHAKVEIDSALGIGTTFRVSIPSA